MYGPKSIFLPLDGTRQTAARICVAKKLAEKFSAEVAAIPCLVSSMLEYPFALDSGAQVVEILQRLDVDRSKQMKAVFEASSEASPLMQWCEPDDEFPWDFPTRALYCDLMVLGQLDPADPATSALPSDFITRLIVETGRPALVLPYIGVPSRIGANVLIAWKETPESARALTASLPWLHEADQVHAVSYGPGSEKALRALSTYLTYEGIHITTHADAAEQTQCAPLLSQAADLQTDLIVMGCYGHSRRREWALGGFTRSVLQTMTVPILFSH